jgi:argininosuccinate lyase
MRERLSADYGQEIIQYLVMPRLTSNLEASFAAMMRINRAHVVMLSEESIIDRRAACTLLCCLANMEAAGPSCVVLDPAKEDLYFNLEAEVIKRIGADVGGQIHTARSRNDLYATVQRMIARGHWMRLANMANALRRRLLDSARQHIDVVMTGYTHLQPAQPITLGHYLSGVADALARDTRRLLAAWSSLNLSPLGAGALATTGFPIRRERTAELLGFDGVLENSLDAVASRDYVTEIVFALAAMAITISRLNHDLHLWYSHEFGYIDISDDIAGTSSIMPQKKNPMPIEHLKAKSGHILGALTAGLAVMKGTGFMHCREMNGEMMQPLGDAVREAEAVLRLADAVLRGLRVNQERMTSAAERNFSTLTDLADALVRTHGFSFRVAHQVVGALAREAIESRVQGATDIDCAMVEEAITRITGRSVSFDPQDLAECLDPTQNVRRRSVTGGPAPSAVERMLARAEHELTADENVVKMRADALAGAEERLRAAAAPVTFAA